MSDQGLLALPDETTLIEQVKNSQQAIEAQSLIHRDNPPKNK